MHCPNCHNPHTKVIDSRMLLDGHAIRRRRKCDNCGKRFTTYERLQIQMPVVAKSDGRRENYNRDKILKGIKKACQKRPISTQQIEGIVEHLEKTLQEEFSKEVTTKQIGLIVMDELKKFDPVAYVRFASFYWNYNDVEDFVLGLRQNYKAREESQKGIHEQRH